MKATEYIASHPVFTTADIQAISPSKETAETVLRRAVESGKAERIRRGLYASRAGAFANQEPDPFDVITAVDPDAVLSYRTALAIHRLSHNVSFDFVFRSDRIRSAFEFAGTRYSPFSADPNAKCQLKRIGIDKFCQVTTREQTFVDCLTHPNRSGGTEEVIRALSSIAYLDLGELGRMLKASPISVCARAGWLLEQNRDKWGVPDPFLDALERQTRGTVRFGSKEDPTLSWSKRWNLALPYSREEMAEWIQ